METYFNVHEFDCWLIPTKEYSPNDHERRDKTPKAVIRISTDGVKTPFDSIRAASTSTGIHRDCITRALEGKQRSAGGYTWEYQTN